MPITTIDGSATLSSPIGVGVGDAGCALSFEGVRSTIIDGSGDVATLSEPMGMDAGDADWALSSEGVRITIIDGSGDVATLVRPHRPKDSGGR